jgi:hypothetical protein
MKRIFKICDIYGTHFHWFFENKSKYYTLYGGIFSILTVFSWIIIFVFFGLDDLKRNNPISNTSTLPPKGLKNIQSRKEKLYLPWRIIDYDNKPVNYEGVLYPKIYYFNRKYNNITGLMDTYYNLIEYKLCNETSMKNLSKEFLLNVPIESLYCINMEDLYIGGAWNSEFINYIRFDLYLCKNGINYNLSNNNCTSYDALKNKIGKNNNWYFELMYPVVQFQPTINEVPILILYKTYFYGLSTKTTKLDRLYLQEHIFEDKEGFITNKSNNRSYWGLSSLKGDNYIFDEDDNIKYGSNSLLYSLRIYLDLGTIYYTRKYKNLFEILSDVFPILKIISIFFCFLGKIINEIQATKKLNEYIIFNNKNKTKEEKKKNPEKNKGNKSRNVIKYSNKSNPGYKEGSINKNNSNFLNNNNLDDSSKINYLSRNLSPQHNRFKSNRSTHTNDNINKNYLNIINVNVIKNNSSPFEFLSKKKYSFKYYLYALCLNKMIPKKKNNYLSISEKFNKIFTFYTHLIDITSYISLFKQFEILKKSLLKSINSKEFGYLIDAQKFSSLLNNELFQDICSLDEQYRAKTLK